MAAMVSMWEVSIKNKKTGEETSIIVPGNNPTQALKKARQEIESSITDPFSQISFGEPVYQFDIPWSSLQ